MPKIVFITATKLERDAIQDVAQRYGYPIVISGIGAISTTISTIDAIDRYAPEIVVQVGIAGAINDELSVGEVVVVGSDFEADLGAYRVETESFVAFNTEKYCSNYYVEGLRVVSGQSVATACTPLLERCADVESMEGAAFMAAAAYKGVKFIEIRSISNYTSQTRDEWQVDKALLSLSNMISTIIEDKLITT